MEKRSESPTESCVSMNSERSKDFPFNFKDGEPPSDQRVKRSESPTESCISMKSERSKDFPFNFKKRVPPSDQRTTEKRSESPTESCVSMKSERSKDFPFNFKGRESPSNQRRLPKKQNSVVKENESRKYLGNKKSHEDLFKSFLELEKSIIGFIRHELERFKKLLRKENTKFYDKEVDENYSAREAVLNLTLHFLKKMKRKDLADRLERDPIEMCQRNLKSNLKRRYECVFEGIATQGKSKLLEKIYTDLYITEGGSGAVNKEHEARLMEKASWSSETQERLIDGNNIFQPVPGQERPIRTVLTKGVAGIGKSISVQKFILDWLKGNANQDIELIFPLPFRELNLKVQKCSFINILHQFFPETKGLMITNIIKHKVLFIFDGLDECQHPLAFKTNEIWSDLTTPTSVDVLLTNLIKGNLLPSALIWITSRPAAAGCIPPDYVDQVTEIHGFNDEQKELYFRKRITDEVVVDKVIKHIKESRSLYIMCHIPVFCWISATVLEKILQGTVSEDTYNKEETLKTLTQMYSYFLIFQTRRTTEKYHERHGYDTEWDENSNFALGQLAFQNLLKNNLIFCESDLRECGISVEDASVYSGVCTQIFKQDSGVFVGTAFCFVHLSIQEFFAALYAHMFFNKHGKNVFVNQDPSEERGGSTLTELLKSAVDKALESESGHFDLFLRFLLGLSREYNQKLLQGLLTQTGKSSEGKEDIVRYIKQKFQESTPPERSINLFYCLNELNDKSLVEEIQNHLRSGSLSSAQLSPAQWSALVFVLMTSEEKIEEFDLKKYIRSDECLGRLLPVVKTATKALLDNCNLTFEGCQAFTTVLSSDACSLKEVDLSNNTIKDFGVKFIAEQLKNPLCKLEILRLSDCGITGEGYATLASALASNSSNLVELDLRGNNPGDSGVKLLTDLQKNSNCKLKTIRFLKYDAAEKAFVYLTSVVGKNPLLLTELDLSETKPGDLGVKQFSALLEDTNCRLQKLKLPDCELTEMSCSALATVLTSDHSNMRELDLSNNDIQDSGLKQLSNALKHTQCKLEKLTVKSCDLTEASCSALVPVLRSDLCSLTELDLSLNVLMDSGVKQLSAGLESPQCKLQILRLNNSGITAEGCATLVTALTSNPSHLIELHLSANKLGDSGMKEISALLGVSNCKLQTLILSDCGITGEGYATLASALKSKPSHLIELDLRGNNPGDSGVKLLTDLQKNFNCKLKTIRFLKSDASEKAYEYLMSITGRDPLLLTELDLSKNKMVKSGMQHFCAKSGMQHFCALLVDSHCKLKKLKLNDSSLTEEGCASLMSFLMSNPAHLIELNLSGNKLGDSGVKHISDLLEKSDCTLQILLLSNCSITGEGYATLASALKSNPSHLVELDLRGNDPGDSAVELLTDLYNLLNDQKCKLQTLRLLKSDAAEVAYKNLMSAPGTNPLLLTELDLSKKKPGDSWVKNLPALLEDSHCKLKKLKLNNSSITPESCAALTLALRSNPSHLIELNLSGNKLGDSGVAHISALLRDPLCKLEKLELDHIGMTDDGCTALASALLLSEASHLTELHLSRNKLGDSVKQLSDLLTNPNYRLQILRLENTE